MKLAKIKPVGLEAEIFKYIHLHMYTLNKQSQFTTTFISLA